MNPDEKNFLGTYILVDNVPVKEYDILKWATWFEVFANRRIKLTTVTPQVQVSTVFLGMSTFSYCEIPPRLFETMIISGRHDQTCYRCATYEQALINHETAVKLAQT